MIYVHICFTYTDRYSNEKARFSFLGWNHKIYCIIWGIILHHMLPCNIVTDYIISCHVLAHYDYIVSYHFRIFRLYFFLYFIMHTRIVLSCYLLFWHVLLHCIHIFHLCSAQPPRWFDHKQIHGTFQNPNVEYVRFGDVHILNKPCWFRVFFAGGVFHKPL